MKLLDYDAAHTKVTNDLGPCLNKRKKHFHLSKANTV